MSRARASWAVQLEARLASGQSCCLVLIARTSGSVPREAGAVMLVDRDGLAGGTIGGGELEYQLIAQAASLLEKSAGQFVRTVRDYPLGPALGQCCGGMVKAMLEVWQPADLAAFSEILAAEPAWLAHDPDSQARPAALPVGSPRPPIASQPIIDLVPFFLYGAGHVGRAVMNAIGGLPLDRHWVDIDPGRFPPQIAADIKVISAADPARIALYSEPAAIHLVMSHAHQLDQDICHAVLKRDDFFQLGLIGSATKRARFEKRLAAAGLAQKQLDRLVCPVGFTQITAKEPVFLGLSIAAQIASWLASGSANQGPAACG